MCRFYSFLTDEKGNRYAMDRQVRFDIRNGKSDLRADSHASIAKLWNIDEDKCNKYEFNPLTKKLILDMQNLSFNDKKLIDIDELMDEVKEAVPELIIKPIINPLKDIKFEGEITDEIIELVKKWSKVRNLMDYSVRNSVGNLIDYSVRNSVENVVGNSVWNSVWNSVGNSIGDSVEYSVVDFIWDSVGRSVYAYTTSFFNINYSYGFSSAIKLWNMGLVPSFDGETWRLHSYKGIIWEGKL